ncbi:hypothetical protein SprV_0100027700 [Sparganum proliferum]
MRPKTPLPPGETTNVIYRIQCSSCEMNYIGETGKRLQTSVGEHMRAVRRMDPLSLVAEHCANSGHTFAFQSAEILDRGNDRIARETIEAWHTGKTSINRCVALPAAYQALRAQLREQRSKRGLRGERNSITDGSIGDTNAAALQLGSGEGAIVTTVSTPTYLAGENTDPTKVSASLPLIRQIPSPPVAQLTEAMEGPYSININVRWHASTFHTERSTTSALDRDES